MSLRYQLPLVILALFLAFTSASHIAQEMIIWPHFVEMERNEAYTNLSRGREALLRELYHMERMAIDWAGWDDTYEFAVDRNQAFVDGNLSLSTFANNQLNLLAILDPQAGLIWGEARTLPDGDLIALNTLLSDSLSPDTPFLVFDSVEGVTSGLVLTDLGPMLLSAHPITNSDLTAPSRGTLLMGRLLDEAFLTDLAEQSRVELLIWPMNKPLPPQAQTALETLGQHEGYTLLTDRDVLHAFTALPRLDDPSSPALLMQVSLARTVTHDARRATMSMQTWAVLTGLMLTVAVAAVLQLRVIQPLLRVSRQAQTTGATGDLTRRLALTRRDEIGQLARAFDDMLIQLDSARKDIADRSFQSGRADLAAGTLHNIRNALSPLTVNVEQISTRLTGLLSGRVRQAVQLLSNPDVDMVPERRADLLRFVDLSLERAEETLRQVQAGLSQSTDQIEHIDAILAEHAHWSNASPVLEPLALDDALAVATKLLPAYPEGCQVVIDPSVVSAPRVLGQRVTLTEVLANLMRNAIEAVARSGRPDGRIRITASFEGSDREHQVRLSVADNGVGISPEILARMFERGFTTQPGRQYGGLGLHWAANAVAAMGGTISAESDGEGLGARTHVVLQVAQQA